MVRAREWRRVGDGLRRNGEDENVMERDIVAVRERNRRTKCKTLRFQQRGGGEKEMRRGREKEKRRQKIKTRRRSFVN